MASTPGFEPEPHWCEAAIYSYHCATLATLIVKIPGLVGLAQTHHPNLFDIQLIISSD